MIKDLRRELAALRDQRGGEDCLENRSPRSTRKLALPTLKLGTYDGTSLETFLAKFENCAEYYDWNERRRQHPLRAN